MDEHSQRRLTKYLGTEVNKFMSKEREEEKTKDDENVVFKVKKNAKIAFYIMCFLMLVVLPIASIKPIFKEVKYEDTAIYSLYKIYLDDPYEMQRRLFD